MVPVITKEPLEVCSFWRGRAILLWRRQWPMVGYGYSGGCACTLCTNGHYLLFLIDYWGAKGRGHKVVRMYWGESWGAVERKKLRNIEIYLILYILEISKQFLNSVITRFQRLLYRVFWSYSVFSPSTSTQTFLHTQLGSSSASLLHS